MSYDPTVGRFLEQDPKGFAAGDPDLYRYVKNDPTNATDPTGLQAGQGQGQRDPFDDMDPRELNFREMMRYLHHYQDKVKDQVRQDGAAQKKDRRRLVDAWQEYRSRVARQVAVDAAANAATMNALAAAATAMAQQSFAAEQQAVNTALAESRRLMKIYDDYLKGLDLAVIHFVAQIDLQHGYSLNVQAAASHLASAFPNGQTNFMVVVGPGGVGQGGNGATAAVSQAMTTATPPAAGLPPGIVWHPAQTTQGPAPNSFGLPPRGT
jgi:uncharacterized protein RhaS with RHS repeats